MSSSDHIDVTAQPVIASWAPSSGASQSLDALRFHIYHHPSTNTAFFKLRATLTFKATGVGRKGQRLPGSMSHPERVEIFTLEDEQNVDEAMSKEAWSEHHCDLKSKGSESDDPLDGLAGSGGYAPSDTTAGAASLGVRLASNKHAADTASLYGGKGGQVVELDSLQIPGPAENGASPPPYSDVGPSPPFLADAPKGKKRRRRSSSEASATESRQDDSKAIVDKKAFAKALKIVFKAELKAELMSELRADVKTELKDELKRELLGEVMLEKERRPGILDRAEERLLKHSDDLEKQLYDLKHEACSTVYSEVEDQTYMARKELEDFVQEECKRLIDRSRSE